ncbi:type 1 glutamine amidotransferase [Canibacter zhoujuaniae]|uniref:type 1 glutamine amidotransferase n=1 Tax=Canibacter zhoujuaniae TaxID=2708343 RepID=UPI001424584D|nr:glutamine amidotransferase [Canibacter zhoujuaniae]
MVDAGKELVIVSLYPREMNMYGDQGNVIALQRRIRLQGYQPKTVVVNPGDPLPDDADIFLGGGGQDSGQLKVAADLQLKSEVLRGLAEDGVPMLMICGLYQLFGHRFLTVGGEDMRGIGVLDVETRGGDTRMIGNIVLESDEFGEIIGYENHSGNTVLGDGCEPFGRVKQGAGNNPDDGHEGARFKNVIGTYLHGALLPKNPAVSDFLIATAAKRKYGEFEPREIDDSVTAAARQSARNRPR